ncbi:Predicted oxidoreductase [Pediococcus ethanolidurans]|nr:aldo/keto reductase [Pediococcus ethanolidurans]SER41999.1 Predicted oxidoreductase [Pediococcus ethanolidurans]
MMTTMQTELKMPKIAMGAWAWGDATDGNGYFGNDYTEADFKPVFEKALQEGLNLWDTAAVYGMGASEKILGDLARGTERRELLLATKFTPQIADGTAEAATHMFTASMERLGTDYADIYWIHNPADVQRWTPQLVPLAKSGQVKYIGVSNHNLAEIKQAQSILEAAGLKLAAVQNHLSLLNRSSENAGIIDYCRENDITFFSYMVLEQGALSGKYDAAHPFPAGSARAQSYNGQLAELGDLIAEMRTVATAHGATVAQIATAWAISKGTVPIVGVTKVKHVEDAANAANIELTAAEVTTLETLAAKTGVATIREWEKDMQ